MARYRGPVSGHFDGTKFHNPHAAKRSLRDFIRWRLTAHPEPWPEWIVNHPHPLPPRSAERGELLYTVVNHATVLLQFDRVNLLTDPIWARRASPFSWLGPKRHRSPGVSMEDLPCIDAVLISHNHYDHLDEETIRKLAGRNDPEFCVPLGLRRLLRRFGARRIRELDWWDAAAPGGARVTAVPSQHFSGRTLWDRNRTPWCGYVIETAAGRIYFAGDTGFGPHFEEIRQRCDPIRLAFLPVGAYLPRWFTDPVHLAPEDAVRAHQVLRARDSVAVHFGTFALADDGPVRPVRALEQARARDPGLRFSIPEFGATVRLA